MQWILVDGNIDCRQENNWIGSYFIDTNFYGWMIGMEGNHLLEKMKWPDNVPKKSNAPAPRPSVSYFQKKRDEELGQFVNNTTWY